MRVSVIMQHQIWDVVVSRNRSPASLLAPVWLVRYDRETKKEHKTLLCQVVKHDRFGWTVVVTGPVGGALRLVNGFKTRWKAIAYALDIRIDINEEAKADRKDLWKLL